MGHWYCIGLFLFDSKRRFYWRADGIQLQSSGCQPLTNLDITSETAGLTLIDNGNNNFKIVIDDDDVATDTGLQFTATTSVIEGCKTANGEFEDHILKYTASFNEFSNVDDTADSVNYKTLVSSDLDANELNITLDGKQVPSPAIDTITVGTDGSAVIVWENEDATQMDKAVKEDFSEFSEGVFNFLVDGKSIGRVEVAYIQN